MQNSHYDNFPVPEFYSGTVFFSQDLSFFLIACTKKSALDKNHFLDYAEL